MGEFHANTATSFGFGTEVEAIRDGWQRDRLAGAKAVVTDDMLAAFGAAGTPADAAESFERFVDAGADSPIAHVSTQWATDEQITETITHL